MFLPSHLRREICTQNQPDCLAGSSTQGKPGSEEPVESNLGIHRFIGVISVICMILIVLALWISFNSWPRRKLRALFCCSRDEPEVQEGKEKVREEQMSPNAWGKRPNKLRPPNEGLQTSVELQRSASPLFRCRSLLTRTRAAVV
jgi:hypothetical protein